MKYLARFQLIFLAMAFAISFCNSVFGLSEEKLIFLPLFAALSCGLFYQISKKKSTKK